MHMHSGVTDQVRRVYAPAMTDFDKAHPLAAAQARGEVMHACPECPMGRPAPFCLVCLGAGIITTARLANYSAAASRD